MKKILVVDDQEDIRKLMRLTLGLRYQVAEAANAGDASDALARERPDLVLLDIMMPGLSGLEWCRLIKQTPELKGVIIIFVSARGQLKDIDAGIKAGADGYITKPFSPLELLSSIEKYLDAPVQAS